MRPIISSVLLLFSLTAFGQQTEYSVSLNSGLFSFTGPSAESTSAINYSDQTRSGYTNNPYGNRNGLCAGLSGTVKRVGKRHFLAGIDLGYERLRSNILIDAVNEFTGIVTYSGTATYQYRATGETYLNYDFLNAHPFIGYRIRLRTVSLDLTGGVDMAYCLKTTETGTATDINRTSYVTTRDRRTIDFDGRYRMQLLLTRKRLGVYAGYSYSLVNYKSGYVGGVNQCSARLIRFGLTYRLK